MDVSILTVAAPSLRADLHASAAQLQLVVASYTIVFAALVVTGARLGDVLGRRLAFMLGLASFTVASLLAGLAPTPELLVAESRRRGGDAGAVRGPRAAAAFRGRGPVVRARTVRAAGRRGRGGRRRARDERVRRPAAEPDRVPPERGRVHAAACRPDVRDLRVRLRNRKPHLDTRAGWGARTPAAAGTARDGRRDHRRRGDRLASLAPE
jgi:hypothetical protein